MEAEWLLAMHFLGIRHPREHDLVATLLKAQRPTALGKATTRSERRHQQHGRVLRRAALRRHGQGHEPLVKARTWILEHGGLAKMRVFTQVLARAARRVAVDRDAEPAARSDREPAPWWFNIYNFASWARATLLPLAVLSARRAVRPLPPERRLDELFPDGRDQNGLPAAEARPVAVVAQRVLALRPLPAPLSEARLHAGPRNGDQRLLGLDRAPSRRRRRLGRHPAAVDLQPAWRSTSRDTRSRIP